MGYEMTLEDPGPEVEADRNHAQILLKITDSLKSDEEGRNLVQGLGVRVLEKRFVPTHWVLVKLDAKDMRNW